MPGRVLYVLNGFMRGGAEIGLLTLLQNGFLKNVDFRILVFFRGNETLRNQILDIIGEERLIEISPSPRMKPVHLAGGFVQILALLRDFQPRTVILSLKQANIVGRAALLLAPRVRVIAFEHIAQFERSLASSFYAAALRLLSFRVNEVWGDCKATLESARTYYWPKRDRPERIAPLFVRPDTPPIKTDYNLQQPIRLAIAGRLIHRKRHDLVLQAMARLQSKYDLKLDVIGDGPEADSLKLLTRSLGLENAITFAGFQPDWWKQASAYDIFVHPSDQEGFCIVAAEAMMVGLPMISTNVGGLLDYGIDSENALFVPTGSVDALVAAMEALISNAFLRRSLGANAARQIDMLYGRPQYIETVSALSASLAEDPSR